MSKGKHNVDRKVNRVLKRVNCRLRLENFFRISSGRSEVHRLNLIRHRAIAMGGKDTGIVFDGIIKYVHDRYTLSRDEDLNPRIQQVNFSEEALKEINIQDNPIQFGSAAYSPILKDYVTMLDDDLLEHRDELPGRYDEISRILADEGWQPAKNYLSRNMVGQKTQ